MKTGNWCFIVYRMCRNVRLYIISIMAAVTGVLGFLERAKELRFCDPRSGNNIGLLVENQGPGSYDGRNQSVTEIYMLGFY